MTQEQKLHCEQCGKDCKVLDTETEPSGIRNTLFECPECNARFFRQYNGSDVIRHVVYRDGVTITSKA